MTSSIRSRSERRRLALVLLVLVGLAPLPAAGGELSQEARAQARVKFTEGNEAYERGDFREALAAFDAAYQLAPLPGFLFNVAQCHRQLGAPERAAFFYRRYLALSEQEPANAALVKELIAEMDAQAKQASPEEPAVQANAMERGRPQGTPPKGSEVNAEPAQGGRALKEAERRALELRKSRSRSAKKKSLPPAAVPAAPAPAPEVKEPLTRKWWVWAGAGAAVLAAGGVIYAVAQGDPRPTTLGTITGR